MLLYLDRHAETVNNPGARMQGQLAHTLRTRAGIGVVRHHLPMGSTLINVLQQRPVGDAPMQMNEYSLVEVLRWLERFAIKETDTFR